MSSDLAERQAEMLERVRSGYYRRSPDILKLEERERRRRERAELWLEFKWTSQYKTTTKRRLQLFHEFCAKREEAERLLDQVKDLLV